MSSALKNAQLVLCLVAIVGLINVRTYNGITRNTLWTDVDDAFNGPPPKDSFYPKIGADDSPFVPWDQIAKFDTRDDAPPTVVSPHSDSGSATTNSIDYDAILAKWQLPESGRSILEEVHSRPVGFDYNKTTDLLALRHPLKTGGTTISKMLAAMFTKRRVVPGSGPSTFFNYDKFKERQKEYPLGTEAYWRNMGVLFTHTLLRPTNDGRKNPLLDWIRQSIPALREKRFRLMTIVRRPLDLAASSYYETLCRIGTHAGHKKIQNISECPAVNLTDVKQKQIELWNEKCKQQNGFRCQSIKKEGADKFFDHCGSLEALFASGNVHNKNFRVLMGDFPRPPELGDDPDEIGINLTPTMDDVALYTMRDLGGLIDYNKTHKEDFVWFAITERMTESLCLFNYRFQIEPVEQKRALYKKCRPLNFWEDKHKRYIEENEVFDYTVWRAANAVMDVRMEDLRLDVKARIDAGERLEDIPYLGEGCYSEEEPGTD